MNCYLSLPTSFTQWDINNKRIFLRADLNVPSQGDTIINAHKLQALLPTLNFLLSRGGLVTVATHRGRPTHFDPTLSTQPIKQWFFDNGYAHEIETQKIIILENLRFNPGEYTHDLAFAQQLAHGHEFYINDAFGSVHRTDTSITIVPQLFDDAHKSIGFLIKKELTHLSKLKDNPEKPFVLIVGGAKAADKLPFINNLLMNITTLLACPLISESFYNKTYPQTKELAQKIKDQALTHHVQLLLPIDYLIGKNGWNGPFEYTSADKVTSSDTIIAVGPNTLDTWAPHIAQAQTIFFNGPMGKIEQPETTATLGKLLTLISQSSGFSVVGGGDAVAAVNHFNLAASFSFCSTGGGATLAYISNQPLPGLDVLVSANTKECSN